MPRKYQRPLLSSAALFSLLLCILSLISASYASTHIADSSNQGNGFAPPTPDSLAIPVEQPPVDSPTPTPLPVPDSVVVEPLHDVVLSPDVEVTTPEAQPVESIPSSPVPESQPSSPPPTDSSTPEGDPVAADPIASPIAAPVVVCPGVAPILGENENGTIYASCWQGYWVIPVSVNLSATNYNIEGRIVIRGDFTLEAGGSLSWRGFPGSEDSRPDVPLKRSEMAAPTGSSRAFILSHVNVTGTLTVRGTIHVNITDENLQEIVGEVDPSNPRRTVSQKIVEAGNALTSVPLQTASSSSSSCRSISVSTEASTTSSGRGQLSAVFSIDDSNCLNSASSKKQSNSKKIASIVAPIVVVVVILIVVLLAVLSRKSDLFKSIVRPFSQRRQHSTMSVSLGSMGSAEPLQAGDIEISDDEEQGSRPGINAGRTVAPSSAPFIPPKDDLHLQSHSSSSTSLISSASSLESSEQRHSDLLPEDSN